MLLRREMPQPVPPSDCSAVAAKAAHVCAVIISAAPHLHLLPIVARSVATQSLPPQQVVVALSGVTKAQCERGTASLASVLGPAAVAGAASSVEAHAARWNWRLLCTEKLHSSGQNRNRGAAACAAYESDTAFISFIDSDDEMRPERLETVAHLMLCHRAHLALHSYVGAKGCCHHPPSLITPADAAAHFETLNACVSSGHCCRRRSGGFISSCEPLLNYSACREHSCARARAQPCKRHAAIVAMRRMRRHTALAMRRLSDATRLRRAARARARARVAVRAHVSDHMLLMMRRGTRS